VVGAALFAVTGVDTRIIVARADLVDSVCRRAARMALADSAMAHILIHQEYVMTPFTRFITFIVCSVAASGAAFATPPADEALVRDIPRQIVQGWGDGDGRAIAAVYADDGVLVAGHGVVLRGPNDIASYHNDQFVAALKGSKLTVQITSVRFLKPDVALLQTEGGILHSGQTELAAGNRGIQSFVVVKRGGEWRIKLFQNTRIL
jgi:uncharacterized protein (TIGR02246 family)